MIAKSGLDRRRHFTALYSMMMRESEKWKKKDEEERKILFSFYQTGLTPFGMKHTH